MTCDYFRFIAYVRISHHPNPSKMSKHWGSFLTHCKVGLWLGKWGGVSSWGWGLPRNQLERHHEAGLALLFQLTCAVSDSRGVGTISQDELRRALLAAIQIIEPLGRGLGLLDCLLRDSSPVVNRSSSSITSVSQ